MEDKGLAKALKRKIGLDEDILERGRYVAGGVSLLMNDPRRRIFQHVCNQPCSHLRGISRSLNMSVQTTRWHLSKLTDGTLVARAQKGKMKVFYPNSDTVGPEECTVLFLLRKEGYLETLRLIGSNQGSTQNILSESLKTYQQRLSSILLSLERAGLIVHDKMGRTKVYTITDKIRNLRESHEAKSKRYEKWIMDVLTKDGVNPTITRSDEGAIAIELDIGGDTPSSLLIVKNPFAGLMGNTKP